MSKHKREREHARPEAPPEDEPTATLYGVARDPGQGFRSVTVELPQSIVERYAVKVSEPDLLAITLGRVVNDLEAGAVGSKAG